MYKGIETRQIESFLASDQPIMGTFVQGVPSSQISQSLCAGSIQLCYCVVLVTPSDSARRLCDFDYSKALW